MSRSYKREDIARAIYGLRNRIKGRRNMNLHTAGAGVADVDATDGLAAVRAAARADAYANALSDIHTFLITELLDAKQVRRKPRR